MKKVYLKNSLTLIEVEEVIRSGETVFVTPANLVYRREELLPVEPAPDILASAFCANSGHYICRTCDRLQPCSRLEAFLKDTNMI